MQPVTRGDSYYEDAVKNSQEVIELLVEGYREEGKALPEMKKIKEILPAA